MQTPEALQKREDLVPYAYTRGSPEEGSPEALQKREDLVPNADTRGSPDQGARHYFHVRKLV